MVTKKRVLLIVESSTGYGRGIVRGIAKYVQERNEWWIDIENRGIHEPAPPSLKNWDGDGIICRVNNRKTMKILARLKCPYVDMLFPDKDSLPMIQTDDREVARLALEHFLESGLKHFGYYAFGKCFWAEERGRIFKKTANESGYACHICPKTPRSPASVDPVWKKEYEKTLDDWMARLQKPIGILTANDSHATRLGSACRKLDIAVPEEVSILGVNNDRLLCQALTPTLSSIDLGPERIGYEAARRLDMKMIGKPLPKGSCFIPPVRVVARQSTDMLAIENEDVVEALRFIREYATQGIGVRQVVEALQVSNRSLERSFKEFLGRTPEREIARVRMNHALELLRGSQLTNEEIAKLSGFGSLRYFLQVFRKERGETPTQYRKREIHEAFHYDEGERDD